MFNVGDRVVYPMHGAGVIEAIEEKEILGEKQQYYIMRLSLGDMRVMIPLGSAQGIGIRDVIDRLNVEQVLNVLRQEDLSSPANWNQRYRSNLEKMKSGDILAVAEVVRNLVKRDHEKGLSTGERKMLDTARQILVSEIVLVQGIEQEKAMRLVEDCIEI